MYNLPPTVIIQSKIGCRFDRYIDVPDTDRAESSATFCDPPSLCRIVKNSKKCRPTYRLVRAFDPKLTNQQVPSAITTQLLYGWCPTDRHGHPNRDDTTGFRPDHSGDAKGKKRAERHLDRSTPLKLFWMLQCEFLSNFLYNLHMFHIVVIAISSET